MMRLPSRLRALAPLVIVSLTAALGAFAAGTTLPARDARPHPTHAAPVHALPPPASGWTAVDRLVAEQKMQAALDAASRLRQQAQQRHQDGEWARGLVREV